MATEHKLITDPYIHEPKGAAAASAGDVYTADGAGGGAWTSPGEAVSNEYGGLYTIHSDSVSIATVGTTVKLLECWEHDAPSQGLVPTFATDKITVATAGDYNINFSLSFETTAVGDAGTYQFHVRVNDVESVIGFHRAMSGTSDVGAGPCEGILTLAAADEITIWVESDEAGDSDDINILMASLTMRLLKAA